ncbi:glycosyltransferase [bacterium]|nr:glycosyltransferase [bacterium]
MMFQNEDSQKNSKRIRILMLTPDSKICGTEQRILNLINNVNRNKFELALVTLFGPGDLIQKAYEAGIQVLNLQLKENSKIQGFMQWRRFVRDFDPHIIQSLLFYSNLLGRFTCLFKRDIAMLSGISTVFSYQEYGHFYAWMEQLTHGLDTLYVANSTEGKESALKLLNISARKMELIHNGIAIEDESEKEYHRIREEARREFGFEKNHLVIGMVAQLRPAKRHDLLLEAAGRLKNDFPTLRLLIVGQGKQETVLREMAREQGVEQETIFAGFRADVRRLLHGLDIFALPSDVEGEPVSIMEAMEASLPVAATRTGGIPEIVEENKTGLLCEPGDVEGLISQLAKFLDSSVLRQNYGFAGRQRIIEQFSAARMAAQFEKLYEKCLQMRLK